MPNTARGVLPYPILSSAADVPADIQALAAAVDAKLLVWLTGVIAGRPAAGTDGRLYRSTDDDRLSYDTGASWRKIMMQIASGDYKADAPVDATAYKVSGTALASTHLSDSAALARLASPALTGTPSAPTAAGGTNTTQLATTAFVAAAIAALAAIKADASAIPGAWTAFTPVLTASGGGVGFGTGGAQGAYAKIGRTVHYRMTFSWVGGSVGSGFYTVGVPQGVPVIDTLLGNGETVVGSGYYTTGAVDRSLSVTVRDNDEFFLRETSGNSTGNIGGAQTPSSIQLSGTYETVS